MNEWKLLAACRGADRPDDAFGTAEEQHAFIQLHCRDCPVQQQCGEYGMHEPGVWGGMNAMQRGRRFGKLPEPPRVEPVVPACGTVQGYRYHREEKDEDACAVCKAAWTGYCNERRRVRKRRAA